MSINHKVIIQYYVSFHAKETLECKLNKSPSRLFLFPLGQFSKVCQFTCTS